MDERRKQTLITVATVGYSILLFFIASWLPVLTKKAAAALTWVVYAKIVRWLMASLGAAFLTLVTVRLPRIRHRRTFLASLIAFICVSVYFLSSLGDSVNEYVHYPQYATLTVLWYLCFHSRRAHDGAGKALWPAVAVAASLGVLEETVQHFLPGRVFDLRDILLNFCGIWLGVQLVWMFASDFHRDAGKA